MSLWRLEWLRLLRTRRLLILLATYGFFALIGPPTAAYLPEILARFGPGVVPALPAPTPADGVAQFTGNVDQLGLLAVAFVAAAALAIDAHPEMAVFLRTRATIPALVVPRYVVNAVAAAGSFAVGLAVAAVGTGLLLGGLPLGGLLLGGALHALYLAFAVAVVAFMASVVRGVPATAGLTVGFLVLLGIGSLLPPLAPWLPAALVGSLDALLRGGHFVYGRAVTTTVLLTALLLGVAVVRLRRREV